MRWRAYASVGGALSLLQRLQKQVARYDGPLPRTMTLGRKILLGNMALLVGLTAVGLASLLGLLALHHRVEDAGNEYSEHRLLDHISSHTGHSKTLLLSHDANWPALESELLDAQSDLVKFRTLQETFKEGSAAHEDLEHREADAALAEIARLIEGARAGHATQEQRLAHLEQLQTIQSRLDHLSAEADRLVEKTHERAGRAARNTLLAIVCLFALIAAGSFVISVVQYRSIVVPLARLREGVRAIATGRFGERLPAQGEQEFAELADDFNRMAAELDGLYRDLEAKVAQKSRELVRSERLASVGFLAAGVAHEISNPLGIMSGFAELSLKGLRQRGDITSVEDAQRTLQIIRDETFRCKEIIHKLLSLSKPGSGERQPLSLAQVAEEVSLMVGGHERYRGRQLRLHLPQGDDLTILGDVVEMKQVLLNLTVNALEAVAPVAGVVTIRGRRERDQIVLCVSDNGCGMTAETREHVFEPFYTTRHHDGQRGMGLGLSITHAIIEGHHGTITAESPGVGLGSRFTVRLPTHCEGARS